MNSATANNNMNDFELYDFIADANFDQFIDLIRGSENEDDRVPSFAAIDGCFAGDSQQFATPNPAAVDHHAAAGVFGGFDDAAGGSLFAGGALLPDFNGEILMRGEEEEEEIDGEDSSGTATTMGMGTGKRGKVDRSRTLISERRRRGRMKEKLYALRSLVPNITKMDKASIVGDAVLYVEDLQAQAKKLKAEIESLEASLEEAERYQLGSTDQTAKYCSKAMKPSIRVPKIIIQMDMFQVEERGFYVKVVCNNGEGTAVSLYKALESLASFNVQTSNLATVSDRFVLTFTLNVKEYEQEQINLPNLKLWVTGAFLNQGFQLS